MGSFTRIVGAALHQHLAVVDDVGAVGRPQRLAHVVVGDQHADAALAQVRATSAWMSPTAIGSMPAKGSSSSMNVGSRGERAGDLDPAPLAARQRAAWRLAQVRSRTPRAAVEAVASRSARGRGSTASRTARMFSLDRQAAEDRGLLRQVADAEARAPVHRQAR